MLYDFMINPTAYIHIYKIYVQPRILYGLKAIYINAPNQERLEVAHRSLVKNIKTATLSAVKPVSQHLGDHIILKGEKKLESSY